MAYDLAGRRLVIGTKRTQAQRDAGARFYPKSKDSHHPAAPVASAVRYSFSISPTLPSPSDSTHDTSSSLTDDAVPPIHRNAPTSAPSRPKASTSELPPLPSSSSMVYRKIPKSPPKKRRLSTASSGSSYDDDDFEDQGNRKGIKKEKEKRARLPHSAVAEMEKYFKMSEGTYPSTSWKEEFAERHGLTQTQVSNWFINYRRRAGAIVSSKTT